MLIRVRTNGLEVVEAKPEGGPAFLEKMATENVKTWEFAAHEPTEFTVRYVYRFDRDAQRYGSAEYVILGLPCYLEIHAIPFRER